MYFLLGLAIAAVFSALVPEDAIHATSARLRNTRGHFLRQDIQQKIWSMILLSAAREWQK
ncbi:hypothetical protein [Candidatus Pyrohabitans sp.]